MDFRETVEKYAGFEVTQEEVNACLPRAERKLNFIISREGDANGLRKTPDYLAMLVGEAIQADAFSLFCAEMSGINRLLADKDFQDKLKESTQHNIEMLPQTNNSVS